jgi:hypothetical protein
LRNPWAVPHVEATSAHMEGMYQLATRMYASMTPAALSADCKLAAACQRKRRELPDKHRRGMNVPWFSQPVHKSGLLALHTLCSHVF